MNTIIAKAELNTLIQYVVYCEHILGYLFKTTNGTILLGVLHGSVLEGRIIWMNSPHVLLPADLQQVRTATKADFEDYRVG